MFAPEIKVINFDVVDVITNSGNNECLTDGVNCPTDMGLG